MDLEAMNNKLEGHLVSDAKFKSAKIQSDQREYDQNEALPTPKLKEIIREFTRLSAHCDKARAICSHNIGQIILDGPLMGYCELPDPPGWNT